MSENWSEDTQQHNTRGVFDEFGEIGPRGVWDFDFRQLDSGKPEISAETVAGPHVAIMSVAVNRSFHQMGCPPPGALSLGLPDAGMQDWFGRPYRPHSILPFNYCSGIDGISRNNFEACTLTISEGFLQRVSKTFQMPVPDYLRKPDPGASVSDSRSTRNLRRIVRDLVDEAHGKLSAVQEVDLVVELLSAAHDESRIEDMSKPATRARAISMTLDYMKQRQHDAPTIGEVCGELGISWRTLNRAFLERFGIGPKAYMQNLRLNAVRHELLAVSRGAVVADVANKWGFWHMGQFARDYRKMYGELPSATLAR